MQHHTINLTDLDMLHKVFRGFRSHDGVGYVFRGHAQASWELLPKAGRAGFICRTTGTLGGSPCSSVGYTTSTMSLGDQIDIGTTLASASRESVMPPPDTYSDVAQLNIYS
jgi:hypothetical protein